MSAKLPGKGISNTSPRGKEEGGVGATFKELKERGQERKICREKFTPGPLDGAVEKAFWRCLCIKVTWSDLLFVRTTPTTLQRTSQWGLKEGEGRPNPRSVPYSRKEKMGAPQSAGGGPGDEWKDERNTENTSFGAE